MIRFNNDYNHGAHPEILEALGAINGLHFHQTYITIMLHKN